MFCRIFELPDTSNSLQGMPEDYIEQVMTSVVSHLHNSPYGLHPLKSVYNLVHHNLEWITEQLDIPPILGSAGDSRTRQFKLITSSCMTETFNPLKECNLIGTSKFNQVRMNGVCVCQCKMCNGNIILYIIYFYMLLQIICFSFLFRLWTLVNLLLL